MDVTGGKSPVTPLLTHHRARTAASDNGRYDFRAPVEEGMNCGVFEAIDRTLQKHVAIKLWCKIRQEITMAEQSNIFAKARDLTSELKPEHVLALERTYLFDAGKNFGRGVGIVTEYCHRGDLNDYLVQHAEPVLEDAVQLRLMTEIARGLEFIHTQEQAHLNIKPRNILLDKNERVKIADFGVTEALYELQAPPRNNEGVSLQKFMIGRKGMPSFQAPEVFHDTFHEEPRTAADIFSAGLVFACIALPGLFKRRVGRNKVELHVLLGEKRSPLGVLESHDADACEVLGIHCQTGAGLQDLLNKMLAHDKSARPKALDVRNTVEGWSPPQRPKPECPENCMLSVDDANSLASDNGRYKYIWCLGNGASCRVFSAAVVTANEAGPEKVAVKLCCTKLRDAGKDALDRFLEDARALASIGSEFIVALDRTFVFDAKVGGFGKSFGIVTEFCSGGDLNDYLVRRNIGREMPREEKFRIMIEITSGLAFIHGRRLTHLDIKPSNILLDDRRSVKISDFGVAKGLYDLQAPDLNFSQYMTRCTGLPSFRAPEVFQDTYKDKPYAPDVFSAGLVFACIVHPTNFKMHPRGRDKEEVHVLVGDTSESLRPLGEKPFEDAASWRIGIYHDTEPKLRDLLDKMLLFDDRDRPSASDVLTTLKEIDRPSPPPPPAPKPKPKWPEHRPSVSVLIPPIRNVAGKSTRDLPFHKRLCIISVLVAVIVTPIVVALVVVTR